MTRKRHLAAVPKNPGVSTFVDTTAPLPNPAITVQCPHCGAAPNQPCGYGTQHRGWQTLVLRRYHPSREDLAQNQPAS